MGIEPPVKRPRSVDFFSFREEWTSRDGRRLLLRSITSADKRIEKDLIDGLSVESSRYRFFQVIKDATVEMVNKFCDIDYENEIAIIAEYDSDDSRRNVGVVRLFIDPTRQAGEFAVLVADDFHDTGLGTKFMETLIDVGQKNGLKSIYGLVLSDNHKMLNLAKEFGFSVGQSSFGVEKIERQL
jgi:acetyltransferase